MANATPSRVGQVNGAGDAKALFLKQFSGEVLTEFKDQNVFLDKHSVRTISSGKSASFPVIGRAVAAYHTPGVELVGQAIKHTEKVITIDDLLIADTFISNIDEAMNHYDVRGPYSEELGQALAITFDTNLAQVGYLAARAAASITGRNGGDVIREAAMNTDAAVLAKNLFAASQKLDEKNVSENDRYAFVKPSQYYLLAQSTNVINRDWGGKGAYSEGEVLKVAGLHIVKTNHLPTTNVITGPTAYQGDFTKSVALVMHKSAIGTVKLLDLAMESEYDIRRQGTLMVAKYAMGHGILRPEAAVELALPLV